MPIVSFHVKKGQETLLITIITLLNYDIITLINGIERGVVVPCSYVVVGILQCNNLKLSNNK